MLVALEGGVVRDLENHEQTLMWFSKINSTQNGIVSTKPNNSDAMPALRAISDALNCINSSIYFRQLVFLIQGAITH